jgi:hypothetical protein
MDILLNIVMDLINALSDNSSINMVQHITIEEAMFSVIRRANRLPG